MGLKLGMDKQAVMSTRYGEFFDLIACDAISRGVEQEKAKLVKMDHDEFLKLR